MNLGKALRALSACMALILGFFSSAALADNHLVASVGGIPITKYELSRKFQRLLPLQGNYHTGVSAERVDEIREDAMTELIEQAYKARYALAEEIAVDNTEVDKELEPVRSQFDSAAAFAEATGEEGISAYRATIYRSLLAEKAEEYAVDAKVSVSDEEVRTYYEANKEKYKRPLGFQASHILIRVDPASNKEELAEIKKKVDDLTARAKSGEDFYDLAYYNSDDKTKYVGGDLGYFHQGQTVPAFDEALVSMKAGEVSDPVRTRYGYHIIKLVDRHEPKQLDFEEVKDRVREQLEQEKRDALYESWMAKLKDEYEVKRFDLAPKE